MIRFFVQGLPAPKGSTRAFYVKSLGRAVITNASPKTRPWEQAIRAEATVAGCSRLVGPVKIVATFLLPRPQSHLGKHGLKPSSPAEHTKKPDLDKLARALLDALTGVAYTDDSQVCSLGIGKRYATDIEQPGCDVTIHDGAGE